jgi:VWFA-related protein
VRRRAIVAAFLCAATAVAFGQGPAPSTGSGQAQQPTFKVQVDYVEVDAIVTNRAGGIVTDLKKEDFQVIEDGQPQTITTFTYVNVPVEQLNTPLGAAAPIEPDVQDNERPFDGRLYVMIIDDNHIAFGSTSRVTHVAKEFIEKYFGSNDLMAVVHTSGGGKKGQEFTSNKRLLLAAVERTIGAASDSATIAKARQMGGPTLNLERAQKDTGTLGTVREVASWFGGLHGRRKSILFVSPGINSETNPMANDNAGRLNAEMKDVIAAATQANATIYGIDPRGLVTGTEDAIEFGPASEVGRHGTSAGPDQSALMHELSLSQDTLRSLSDNTGGFAVLNRNDPASTFQRIVQDNSSYYVLAYYPPAEDKKPGKFHKIEVRVSRPDVTVRARQGYATPGAKAAPPGNAAKGVSPEIRTALDSPLPVTGLTLHVFAAPFKGSSANASVFVLAELSGRDLKLSPKNTIELSYQAADAEGKARGGDTQLVTLPENVRPEISARMAQLGLRITDRFDLPPGRYQMHVAAHDMGGGSLGSIAYDLDVPDFTKGPLTISGLAVTSDSGSLVPTMHPDAQLKEAMQASPVALRRFPAGDELGLFAEVYDNEASTPHKVDITTTITADDSKVVFKADAERESSEIQGKRGGYGYAVKVPLAGLAPGRYVLSVEARSRLGGGATARRDVPFTIE